MGAPAGASVELIVADLASQAEVLRVAREIRAKHERLDVLLNNAGVIVPARRTTVDGIEETLAINHLAYFLLTRELLDLLKSTGSARVVNVASEAHRNAQVHWDDIQFERTPYRQFTAYGQSKLCNILFTRELAKRLEGTRVTANCLHPGVIGSGFGQTYAGPLRVLMKVARPFLLTPEKGARTQVWLASSSEVEGVSGKYFDKCKERRPSRRAREEDAPRRLWELTEGLLRKSQVAGAAA
jgi:NAD(P)-dependent dehydrogenase (short-subunit alcohol dehydrogenase family)